MPNVWGDFSNTAKYELKPLLWDESWYKIHPSSSLILSTLNPYNCMNLKPSRRWRCKHKGVLSEWGKAMVLTRSCAYKIKVEELSKLQGSHKATVDSNRRPRMTDLGARIWRWRWTILNTDGQDVPDFCTLYTPSTFCTYWSQSHV